MKAQNLLFSRFDTALPRRHLDPQHRAREARELRVHTTRKPRPSQVKNYVGHATTRHMPSTRAGWRLEVGQEGSAAPCVLRCLRQKENNSRCAILHHQTKQGHNYHASRTAWPCAGSTSRHSRQHERLFQFALRMYLMLEDQGKCYMARQLNG